MHLASCVYVSVCVCVCVYVSVCVCVNVYMCVCVCQMLHSTAVASVGGTVELTLVTLSLCNSRLESY